MDWSGLLVTMAITMVVVGAIYLLAKAIVVIVLTLAVLGLLLLGPGIVVGFIMSLRERKR